VEYRRVLKVVFDIFARVDPDAWKDWRTARDNAFPGCSPGGSALITSDRAELRETAPAATPAMSRIYLVVHRPDLGQGRASKCGAAG